MFSIFQGRKRSRRSLHNYFASSLFLSAIALFNSVASATAAETVFLRYQNITTTLPVSEIEEFATEGETSEALEAFLDRTPLSADLMATLLADEIPDTGIPLGPTDIQFLLFQLNKLVGDPLERENLNSLGQALYSAFLDKNMSVLELVKRYPESEVRLDLGRLSRVHRDIDLFVRRLSTLFSFFEDLLPDLVCECEETISREIPSSKENLAIATVKSQKSRNESSCKISDDLSLALEIIEKEVLLKDSSTSEEAIRLSQSSSPTLLSPYRPSRTAEEIILVFGPLRFNFSIDDLTTFAETGKVPPGWRFFMAQANLKPEDLQTILTSETKLELASINRILKSLLGEYALFQLGQIIHTPSSSANVQSIRSAVILSTLDDSKISLLEFLGNFPTQQVIIEGEKLLGLGKNLQDRGLVPSITGNLEDLLVEIQVAIADQICNCSDRNLQ